MVETLPVGIMQSDPEASGLPSGYLHAEQIDERMVVDEATLPWLEEPKNLAVALCTLRSGESFYLASAIGTHPKLIKAAEDLNPNQQQNVNNMFYSRLPQLVLTGHSPSIETMPKPATDFPIRVLRNQGGQRVYSALYTPCSV